jgi:proline iminopeptidase
MEYALKYQKNLKGLVIGMMASGKEYGAYANEVLAKQMKPGTRRD